MRYGYWYTNGEGFACYTGEGLLEEVIQLLKEGHAVIVFATNKNKMFDSEGGLDYDNPGVAALNRMSDEML